MTLYAVASAGSITSPLEGEVAARSAAGVGYLFRALSNTPLPNPPPQGGRERAVLGAIP
jgi:hypothetical protein